MSHFVQHPVCFLHSPLFHGHPILVLEVQILINVSSMYRLALVRESILDFPFKPRVTVLGRLSLYALKFCFASSFSACHATRRQRRASGFTQATYLKLKPRCCVGGFHKCLTSSFSKGAWGDIVFGAHPGVPGDSYFPAPAAAGGGVTGGAEMFRKKSTFKFEFPGNFGISHISY